jgi:hypothetical protein
LSFLPATAIVQLAHFKQNLDALAAPDVSLTMGFRRLATGAVIAGGAGLLAWKINAADSQYPADPNVRRVWDGDVASENPGVVVWPDALGSDLTKPLMGELQVYLLHIWLPSLPLPSSLLDRHPGWLRITVLITALHVGHHNTQGLKKYGIDHITPHQAGVYRFQQSYLPKQV